MIVAGTGCQGPDALLAPATMAGAGPSVPRPEAGPAVPRVQRLFARADDGTLTLVAQYDGLASGEMPPFSPDAPGGWCFQLFLDVDGDSLGYSGAGWDYVLRSMEYDPRGVAALRRTVPGGGPGGWGETVGDVPVAPSSRRLLVTVPLATIGGATQPIDFVLELYETMDGESGVVHRYAANYAGTVGAEGGELPLAAHSAGPVAPFAVRPATPLAPSR